jgi:O-antigen/teichoic acid export membrane protein
MHERTPGGKTLPNRLMAVRKLIAQERKSFATALQQLVLVGSALAVGRAAALASAMIVARYTDAEIFGIFTLFTTVFLLGSEIPNSFDAAYVRLANAPVCNVPADVLLALDFLAKAVLAAVASLLALCAGGFRFLSQATDTAGVTSMAICLGTLASTYTAYLSSYQQVNAFKIFGVLKPVPNLLIMVGMIVLAETRGEFGLSEIQTIYLFVALLMASIGSAAVASRIDCHAKALSSSVRRFGRIATILLATSAITKIGARFDVFLLVHNLAYAEFADYGVGMRVSLVMSLVTGSIGAVLLPKAPSVQGSRKALVRYVWLAIFYAIPQTMIGVALILWRDSVVEILFGASYLTQIASTVSAILIAQMLFSSYALPFQVLVQFGANPEHMMYTAVARSAICAVALWLAVPWLGAVGAALVMFGMSVTFLFLVIWLAVSSRFNAFSL